MSTRALDGGHGLHIYLNSASVCVAIKLKLSLFLILLLFFFLLQSGCCSFCFCAFGFIVSKHYHMLFYVGYFFSLCRVFKLKFSLLSFTLFYIFSFNFDGSYSFLYPTLFATTKSNSTITMAFLLSTRCSAFFFFSIEIRKVL